MYYYELFQQGPAVYIPTILFSLLITLVVYCAVPLGICFMRKKPIKSSKYLLLSYGINFAISIIVFQSSGSAWLLWTAIFTEVGKRKLRKKCLIIDKYTAHYFSENKIISTVDDMNEEPVESPVDGRVEDCLDKIDIRPTKKENPAADVFVEEVDAEESFADESSTDEPVVVEDIGDCDESHVALAETTKTAEEPKIKFCRKCGLELIEGSIFCSRCGTEITKG